MGNTPSAQISSALGALDAVAGPQPLGLADESWQPLLTFPVPLSRWPEDALQAAIRPYCGDLVYHNCQTYNLQRLVILVCRQLDKAKKSGGTVPVANALCLLRVILQDLMEKLTPAQLQSFVDLPHPGSPTKGLYQDLEPLRQTSLESHLAGSCLQLLVTAQNPTSAGEYLTRLQLLQLLLILLSTQLFTSNLSARDLELPFLFAVLERRELAPAVMQTLLRDLTLASPPPLGLRMYLPTDTQAVLRAVRAAASGLVWLPVTAFTFLLRRNSTQPGSSPIALHAGLLLLALCFHAASPGAEASPRPAAPFRAALQRLQDADDADTEEAAEAGHGAHGLGPTTSFATLLGTLCAQVERRPEAVLMLYASLHRSVHFAEYILARADPETLLIPLLAALNAQCGAGSKGDRGASYMLLAVLLILSADAGWSASIQLVQLEALPPGFGKRGPRRQTLGSLAMSVLLRAGHSFLARQGDAFLQTNTLAVLANLAPHVSGLSSEAAQRLVSLISLLARRCRRLGNLRAGECGGAAADGFPPPAQDATAAAAGDDPQLAHDFLKMALESTSAMLERSLPSNPTLIYALLHRAELFEGMDPAAPDLAGPLANIAAVISHFSRAVEGALGGPQAQAPDAGAVMAAIQVASRAWRRERLQPGTQLHFQYEEGEHAEAFFVPCVWARVLESSALSWDLAAVRLFTPEGLEAEAEQPLHWPSDDTEVPNTAVAV